MYAERNQLISSAWKKHWGTKGPKSEELVLCKRLGFAGVRRTSRKAGALMARRKSEGDSAEHVALSSC